MSRNHRCLIRKSQYAVAQRPHDLFKRTSGKIRPPNAAGKQGVARNQHLLGGKIQADAAFGMTRRRQTLAASFPARSVSSCAKPASISTTPGGFMPSQLA